MFLFYFGGNVTCIRNGRNIRNFHLKLEANFFIEIEIGKSKYSGLVAKTKLSQVLILECSGTIP